MRRAERNKLNLGCPPVCVALALGALMIPSGTAQAGEGTWSVRLEPIAMQVYGHDQHVLTIHEMDLDSTPATDRKTAVSVDPDDGPAYRGEFRFTKSRWGWGLDFLWFSTPQQTADHSAAAGGAADQVVFEIADQSFTSFDPSQRLLYHLLEDNDLALWTVDLYGMRTLAEGADSDLRLHFGLKVGDFDNDYRAVVGIDGVMGSRLDASSNYDRMMGPLVGLSGNFRRGPNQITGYLGQSVLLGSVELSHMSRLFAGPLDVAFPVDAELETVVVLENLNKIQDVAIPVTEFRVDWTYRVGRHLSLGLGADTYAWWDVPVPPGVVPITGGDEVLSENTLVFFGLSGTVQLTF